MLVQVVGGVGLHVRAGDGAGVVRQRIEQRGVDLQQAVGPLLVAGALQPVVNDRGDVGLIRAVGLLLDQGGDGDDLLQGVAGLLHLGHPLLVHAADKVADQPVQGVLGVMAHIELIGVREEEALQSAQVLGFVVDEVVVKIAGLGGLSQGLLRVDALFRQQGDGLADGVALRNGDGHRLRAQVAGGAAHPSDQGVVVHVGVQLIGADAHLFAGAGDGREQAEEPLVADQSGVLQLFRDAAHVVIRGDLNGDLGGGGDVPAESTQVAGQQPAHASQDGRGHQHAQDIQDRVDPAALAPPLRLLGRIALAPPRMARLAAAHLGRVPAGGIAVFVIRHRNLHFLAPAVRRRKRPGMGKKSSPPCNFFQRPGSLWKPGA